MEIESVLYGGGGSDHEQGQQNAEEWVLFSCNSTISQIRVCIIGHKEKNRMHFELLIKLHLKHHQKQD